MNQSDAADVTRRMAQALQNSTGNDPTQTYTRVENAVFGHAFEFIPDEAPHAVVDHEGQPLVLALDGTQLYVLSVDDLRTRTVGASTSLDVFAVDPLRSKVRSTVEFLGVRANADPVERKSTWTFDINGKFGISISTHVIPESERTEGDEDFAQALASEIGWRSPKRTRRVVTVRAA